MFFQGNAIRDGGGDGWPGQSALICGTDPDTNGNHDGTVTASLLVARLHAQQPRSRLAAALQDYGRLIKTEFILRYLTHPPDRRGIHRQLNKHESIKALEDAVF